MPHKLFRKRFGQTILIELVLVVVFAVAEFVVFRGLLDGVEEVVEALFLNCFVNFVNDFEMGACVFLFVCVLEMCVFKLHLK